jgi:hypothetical protein
MSHLLGEIDDWQWPRHGEHVTLDKWPTMPGAAVMTGCVLVEVMRRGKFAAVSRVCAVDKGAENRSGDGRCGPGAR